MKLRPFLHPALLSAGLLTARGFDPIPVLEPPRDLPVPSNVGIYFGRQQNLEAAIITALKQAKSEILVNQLAITNPKIAEALLAAYRRKVVVGVILDAHPPFKNYGGYDFLMQHGIPYLLANTETPNSHNNHKYAVIDRRIVLMGSFDWTVSARTNNEDLLVIDDSGIASQFVRHWIEESQTARIPLPPKPETK